MVPRHWGGSAGHVTTTAASEVVVAGCVVVSVELRDVMKVVRVVSVEDSVAELVVASVAEVSVAVSDDVSVAVLVVVSAVEAVAELVVVSAVASVDVSVVEDP